MKAEEFTEALESAVPPKPATTGWGARARRRSRNRRAAGAVGLVGAMVLTVAVMTLQIGGDPTITTTPAPAGPQTLEPAVTDLVPEACERVLDASRDVTELPDDGRMPTGATQVWLCGGQTGWGVELVGAAEPLTRNVEAAVAAFNAEPTSFTFIDCDSTRSEQFTVVYEYPDGSRYEAEVWRGMCSAVMVGSRLRFEPDSYMQSLESLWKQQRTAAGPSFVPGDAVCPDKSSVFDISPHDAVSGFVCTPAGQGHGDEARQIRLSDELVLDIAAEIRVTDSGPEPGLDRTAPSLVLLTQHGDPFTIFGTPETGYRWYPPRNETGMQYWTPSPELATRMSAEITQAVDSPPPPTPPPPPSSPAANVQADCATEGGIADAEVLTSMTQGIVCVPLDATLDPEWHVIELPEALLLEVVTEAGTAAQINPAPDVLPDVLEVPTTGLILSGPDGAVKLDGDPNRYGWQWSDEMMASWEPSPQLAEALWAWITRDGSCILPPYLTVVEVPVHVYDAGGGPEAVNAVVTHLTAAGFPVTSTGQTQTATHAAGLTVRGGYENGQTVPLVGTWIDNWWAEMSRNDGTVDILVTHLFTPDDLIQGDPEILNGYLTCS